MEHFERPVVGYWVQPLTGEPVFVQTKFWDAMKHTYASHDVYEVVRGRKIQGDRPNRDDLVFPAVSGDLLDNPPVESVSHRRELGKQCDISGGVYTSTIGNAISTRKQWKGFSVDPAIVNALTDALGTVEHCHIVIAKVYVKERPERFYYTIQLLPLRAAGDMMNAIRMYSKFKAVIDSLGLRYVHYNATHAGKAFHSAWTLFVPMQGVPIETVSPELVSKISAFENYAGIISKLDLAPERRLDKNQDEYDVFLLDNNLLGTKIQLNTLFK